MKNKPMDVPYCGVRKEVIQKAKPKLNEEVLRYHHLYMTERHRIYKRKEILKLPREQWTEDEVFKKYRFTNVRRELDRETKWLIDHVSLNDELNLEQKVLNSILFRTFNKHKTFEIIDYPIKDFDNIDIDAYRKKFQDYERENPKYVFFTPAFNTGGLKSANAFPYEEVDRSALTVIYNGEELKMNYKEAREFVEKHEGAEIKGWEKNIPTRMIIMIKKAYEKGIHKDILNSKTQKEAYEKLLEIPGFSEFLAYQVFVDLTYIPEFPFSENEFVVSGPGCSRGINLLFEDKDGMTDEECIFWVRDNIEKEWDKRGLHVDFNELFDHLPEYDRKLNVMMLENSFCELSKLTKAKRGEGRPRNTYVPTEEVTSSCDGNECVLEEWL